MNTEAKSAPPKRWRRRKHKRPGEIVHAALVCFGEKGFAATKIDDVAEMAGVTKGTVYLYFESKEHLFKEVISVELVPLLASLEKTLSEAKLGEAESLRLLLKTWAEIFPNSALSPLPKLIVSEIANFPDLADFYVREVVGRGLGLITGILTRGIEKGEFRRVDVTSAVFCVIAPALVAMLWKHSLAPFSDRRMDVGDIIDTHSELLLRGLAA
ncbi:MAG: TetR/AcrR family transcriptional regulator [Pyrinomonadaceae bacterium]